jgi:pimeloyl-ACP methyl ester carboxylesterase
MFGMARSPETFCSNVGFDRPARLVGLARVAAWITLALSNQPTRRLLGSLHRRRDRKRGGRPFTVTSDDGTRLHAWHVPASGDMHRTPVVMLHGWLEVKEFHLARARRLSEQGRDVILFDHRGHGLSDRALVSFGPAERADLRAVLDAGQSRGLIGQRVIPFGYSMGAAVAIQHAMWDARVGGVVAFAPFVNLPEAIRSFRDHWWPMFTDRWLLSGFERTLVRAGYDLYDSDTAEAMAKLENTPVLLIEGSRDKNLPPNRHVTPLAERARGPLERFRVARASHLTIYRRTWPGLDHAIQAFCRRRG